MVHSTHRFLGFCLCSFQRSPHPLFLVKPLLLHLFLSHLQTTFLLLGLVISKHYRYRLQLVCSQCNTWNTIFSKRSLQYQSPFICHSLLPHVHNTNYSFCFQISVPLWCTVSLIPVQHFQYNFFIKDLFSTNHPLSGTPCYCMFTTQTALSAFKSQCCYGIQFVHFQCNTFNTIFSKRSFQY